MVYCKTGRPEIANDVMGVHQTDVWTMLKPQDEWRPGLTRDALIEEMDKALTENVPGREVRLQPADRDAGQRAGGGGQERRGRPALRPRPRRAPAEGGRDRARARARSRARRTSRRRPRAGCRCSASRSAATSSRGTGSRRPTCSTPSPRSAGRPSAPSSRGRSAHADPGPPARVAGGTTPRRSRSIRIVDPKGRPIALRDLADIDVRGRARARSSARTSSAGRWSASTSGAATSPGSSPRPRPRSTPRSSCPPATSSAGAASSSTSRRPRSGS